MKIAFSPLPWYFGAGGWQQPAAGPMRSVYAQIRSSGFEAVPVELPAGVAAAAYRALVEEAGLQLAPGYLQLPLAEPDRMAAALEEARRVAAAHAELGQAHVFVADEFGPPERVARPAVGTAASPDRLRVIADNAGALAEALRAEGLLACLHPHVGTWIETEAETVAVLEAVSPDLLLFGPDVGHLAWAGADVAGLLGRYAGRVGALHLKDVRTAVRDQHVAAGAPYLESVTGHLFTEPGRGDLDLDGMLAALPGFAGWCVLEVDVPGQATPLDTARESARWAACHLPLAAARR